MSLLSNVIHKMRGGTRLVDAVMGAIEDAKQQKINSYVTCLQQAYNLRDSDPPPMSRDELAAFEERMNTLPKKLENYNRLSEGVKDAFLKAAYDSIHLEEGGAVQYAHVFQMMQGYMEAARTVGETAEEAFAKFKEAIRDRMGSGIEGRSVRDNNLDGLSILQQVDHIEKLVRDKAVSMAWQSAQNNPGIESQMPETRSSVVVETKTMVSELMGIESDISGKITEGMQYLYNLRKNYEIFSQMAHEGASILQIKDTLKNTMTSGSEPADVLDTRIQFFVEEYNSHNGSRELSLMFMAERMSEFNRMVEASTVGKVANEMDVNPNRNFIGTDYTSNFDVIMEAIGADAFQNMVGMFHKDKELEEALRNIEQHNRVMFSDTRLVDTGLLATDPKTGRELKSADGKPVHKYLFSTRALFDNGLPSGIELKFDIQPDNKIQLAQVDFHGQKLDQATFLKTPEIQHIIAQLPPAMKSQMEKNLVVRMENGVYRPGIIANAMSKEAVSFKAAQALNAAMDKNFQITFGSGEAPDLPRTAEPALREDNKFDLEGNEKE